MNPSTYTADGVPLLDREMFRVVDKLPMDTTHAGEQQVGGTKHVKTSFYS